MVDEGLVEVMVFAEVVCSNGNREWAPLIVVAVPELVVVAAPLTSMVRVIILAPVVMEEAIMMIA